VWDVGERFVVTRSGLKVHVVESGNPQSPPVVFVPGWACNVWIFHDTLEPFAKNGFHAIAVELKGHGQSDKPASPDEYTLESMRDHLLEIIDALGLESCGIVGHSMGAAIVVAAAARCPHRFSKMVMAAPVGFAGVRGMTLFRAITPRFLEPVLPKVASRTLVRLMLSVVYGSLRRASMRDIEEFHAPVKLPGYTTALRNLLHRFDWCAPFPALSMPTLIIVGSEDVLSPAKEVDRYAGDTGQAVIIEGAGHVLFDEAPDEVNALLAEFFAELRGPYISASK
jgi:pimeloyl-ACP methyl ester carboxylesterase